MFPISSWMSPWFQAKPGAFYFPSAIELLISLGFVALAIAAFTVAVKLLAILPAPTYTWYRMDAHEQRLSRLQRGDMKVTDVAAPSFTD